MSDHDHLRDLLERTAPDRPELDPGTRAATVARRGRAARRRDRGLVLGCAVAVITVAVGVPLALRGGDGSDVATPPARTAPACPTDPIDVDGLPSLPALGDVVAVRSCPTAGDAEAADPLPSAPLTGDAAAAFAADVETLPPYAMPSLCATVSMVPQPWALVVTTADGGTEVLGSTMRACSAVPVDGIKRGSEDVIAAFEGNLQRQVDNQPRGLDCPTGKRLADAAETWNASFDIATATEGVVCYRVDPMGSRAYNRLEGELSVEQLAVVVDDLVARVGRQPAEMYGCVDTGPQRMVVLTDGDGDRAAFLDDRCSGGFSSAHGYWLPGRAAEDVIADALGGRV